MEHIFGFHPMLKSAIRKLSLEFYCSLTPINIHISLARSRLLLHLCVYGTLKTIRSKGVQNKEPQSLLGM